MAAGHLRKLLEDAGTKNIEVRSAGVMTVPGLLATSESKQMLTQAGVELRRHLSTPMTVDLLRRADLILGMTPLHIQQALRLEPSIRDRAFLFKEFTRTDLRKVQIEDPMGNTLEVYKRVFREIRIANQRLIRMPFFTGHKQHEADLAATAALRAPQKRAAASRPQRAGKGLAPKSAATMKSGAKKPIVRAARKVAATKIKAQTASKPR